MANEEGWIEWGGGECPVDGDVRVDVRHFDGTEHFDVVAGEDEAEDWSHDHPHVAGDIIAYRIAGA